MRLWHKELIPWLPNSQLLSQWRELVAIKRKIDKVGTPNHLLVNKVLEYPRSHFVGYSYLVYNEMIARGFSVNIAYLNEIALWGDYKTALYDEIYPEWHNDRYLNQCLANLEEKYDCGGISDVEWKLILENIAYAKKYYNSDAFIEKEKDRP